MKRNYREQFKGKGAENMIDMVWPYTNNGRKQGSKENGEVFYGNRPRRKWADEVKQMWRQEEVNDR